MGIYQIHQMFEKYHFLFLFLLFFSAFFIRVYALGENPTGMYIDEVSSAYNAYSIMKTGKDEHGNYFPLFFQAFGEYRHGFYVYSMIPTIFVFGLNEFGIRFTSVLFGMGSLFVFYFLIRKCFDEKSAFVATLFLAIQPWHFHLSRVAFEGISFVFLFLLGLLLFYNGFEKKKYFIASTLIFSLCLYSYGTAKLFIPLFLFGLFIIYRDHFFHQEKKTTTILCIILFLILTSPIYYLSLFSEANARFQQGSIFILSEHPIFTFFINYGSHYTTWFLFFSGDAGLRHHLYNFGVLYYFEIILFFFSILLLWKKRDERRINMLILWLVLFAFPASFMYGDTPHALRTFIGAPLFALLSSLGLFYLRDTFIEKYHRIFLLKNIAREQVLCLFWAVLCFVIVIHFIFFVHEYFTDYKVYSYDYWMAYAEPMLEYTESVRNRYENVYFSANSFNRFYIYILYYLKTDPAVYQATGFENATGYDICDINLCFNQTQKNLYVFRGFELKTTNGIHQIYYPNNEDIAVKFVG